MIGQRLIPRLVQAGHVVGGLTRCLSLNWSVPFSPRVWRCAMDNPTGPAFTTSSNHRRNRGFISTEQPNAVEALGERTGVIVIVD